MKSFLWGLFVLVFGLPLVVVACLCEAFREGSGDRFVSVFYRMFYPKTKQL